MSASEKLLAAPLPQLIEGLGMAVATANKKLAENPNNDIKYAIHEAEVELKVAISIDNLQEASFSTGANIQAFSINASYKGTFGYKEEASSSIKLKLSATPIEKKEKPDN